ncbi:AAA domain-containing protein [Planctomycetaceae bacterium SH139]
MASQLVDPLGPPGTGKTWTTGQQVAAILEDPHERILVVSTTNQATDAVAISIGSAALDRSTRELPTGKLVRLGRGTNIEPFNRLELMDMLGGADLPPLQRNEALSKELDRSNDSLEKAFLRRQLSDVRQSVQGSAQKSFLDRDMRVVVTTAYKALNLLRNQQLAKFLRANRAPFTTVFIDEAGLISRAAVAALSYLAASRIVLVGDSKQLAPISRIARLLPTRQENWLASSGLSHLQEFEHKSTAVHQLNEQRRMHQDVCKVVSDYQYDGRLITADAVRSRSTPCPAFLTTYSRTIWFVLDAVTQDLAAIRACRGPNNRSWIRPITPDLLERVMRIDQLHSARGLFLSPFTAQTRAIAECLSKWGFTSWQSSTVHAQQGSEADIVIFDTVNAGSCGWPYEEWKRLINVGLSRARQGIILLASRAEMDEPFLRPLVSNLQPSTLTGEGSQLSWTLTSNSDRSALKIPLANTAENKPNYASEASTTTSFEARIKARQKLPPLLSRDQQRLVNLTLDGKPRLVRGVAGSGKSMVLAEWLARTIRKRSPHEEGIIWAVYANRSLDKLLRESIESAWDNLHDHSLFESPPFPWDKVNLLHIKDVLRELLPSMELTIDTFDFDYDRAAAEFLSRHEKRPIQPRCDSLFVDEAQDMGPSTLKLLMSLIKQSDPQDTNSRSANIFYDNAQNIYGRKTPKWSDFGLDLRGRSTILRDSFRSTAPILELAANVLHRLAGDKRDDEAELLRLNLLEPVTRNGQPWLHVNYNQVSGPKPALRLFPERDDEFKANARHLIHYIQHEQISPHDICLLYNGPSVAQQLRAVVEPALETIGVELSLQTNRSFQRLENTLVATTPNSFKGYESEVVVIPAVDRFVNSSDRVNG